MQVNDQVRFGGCDLGENLVGNSFGWVSPLVPREAAVEIHGSYGFVAADEFKADGV